MERGWKRMAVMKYCRLRGGKGIWRWWENKIGRRDDDNAVWGGRRETLEHIVFRCRKIKRISV